MIRSLNIKDIQISPKNQEMISSILSVTSNNVKISNDSENHLYKIHNLAFDILIKNNRSIMVIDKRNPSNTVIYKSLLLAFSNLRNQFQRNGVSYQIQ